MDRAASRQEARQQQDFATMILDNLKKAGVQNTRKPSALPRPAGSLRRDVAASGRPSTRK